MFEVSLSVLQTPFGVRELVTSEQNAPNAEAAIQQVKDWLFTGPSAPYFSDPRDISVRERKQYA